MNNRTRRTPAAGHSHWQLSRWLEDCTRAGVLVLPDEDLWKAALIAADITIGDHGSVSYYSAALGTPLLLASAPEDAVDPGSPIGELLDAAPRFVREEDLPAQLDRVIAEHDPDRFAPIIELATSVPGKAGELLCELCYEELQLTRPVSPAPARAVPVPVLTFPRPNAQFVRVVPDHTGEEAEVTRYAADVLKPSSIPEDAHLVVDTTEPDLGLLELADLVIHRHPDDARRWIRKTLSTLPGCQAAAARTASGSWLVGDRTGALTCLTEVSGAPEAFALLVRLFPRNGLRIRLGGTTHTARVRTDVR